MNVVLAGLLIFGLAACASNDQRMATVSVGQAALASLGRTVLACYAVPRCAVLAPKPQIKAAFDAAYAAVSMAQAQVDAGAMPDTAAAAAAIAALQVIVAALPLEPLPIPPIPPPAPAA